jgi:NDP-sugar pyrophosphorylase family protein
MKAVILAGGLGMRLRPFTEVIPKPLLPIGEKSLLEIQIGRLRDHGFTEIYFATNYKSEYITNFFGDGSRYGVDLTISKEEVPLGTAGPVTLLKERLTEPYIVMNGDILSTIDFRKFYDFALRLPADICVAVKKIVTPYDFGTITHEGDFVTAIEEKPNLEMEVIAGIYVFKPALFDRIPEREYYGVDRLIQEMLAEGAPVGRYELEEYWLDIGQVPDYELAQEAFETHFNTPAPETDPPT